MQEFFTVLGFVLGALILVYIIGKFFSEQEILVSQFLTGEVSEVEADQYYYLPGASLTITATATVIIAKSASTKRIRSTTLSQLALDAVSQLEPDTGNMVLLNYKSDWFSNDEVKVTTSANALLENISSTSEDRIGEIVAQFTNAVLPKSADLRKDLVSEVLVKETKTYKQTFKISTDELAKKEITREWKISVEGSPAEIRPINASFCLRNPGHQEPLAIDKTKTYAGIYTRPLLNKTWDVHVALDTSITADTYYAPNPSVTFTVIVPDTTRLLKVPIRRGFFIKKTQLPKFSNGLLVENYFNKPSEIESLAAIPINVLKAIVSIPAALLQFKITRNKQELEYEKSLKDLEQLRASAPKPAPTAADTDAVLDAIRQKLKDLQTNQPPAQEDTEAKETPVPKLGKLPAQEGAGPKAGFEEIKRELLRTRDRDAPQLETQETCFWNSRFLGDWMSYDNETIMDCVPAAGAHMIMCWTCNTRPMTTRLTLNDVISAYSRESGYRPGVPDTDKGCGTLSFLANWRDRDMGGNRIRRFAGVAKGNRSELKQAISLFGACMVGFKMPNSAKDQRDAWEIVNPDGGDWGPHAVAAVGYDSNILLVVSWGRVIKVNWDFYEKYNDEAYAVLSDDWIQDGKAPNRQDLAALNSVMDNMV